MVLPEIDTNFIILAALVLVALILIGLLVRSWIKAYQEKKDTEGAAEFSKDTAVSSSGVDGAADAVKEALEKAKTAAEKAKLEKARAALKSFDAIGVAKQIYDSTSFYNDDEDKLYSAFNTLKNRLELSLLGMYFKDRYGKTLQNFISDSFNPEEVSKVNNIISKLPAY